MDRNSQSELADIGGRVSELLSGNDEKEPEPGFYPPSVHDQERFPCLQVTTPYIQRLHEFYLGCGDRLWRREALQRKRYTGSVLRLRQNTSKDQV